MARPALNEIPLSAVNFGVESIITMSTNQWDGFLAAAYEMGFVLLEVDGDEQPVHAYKKVEELVQ